MVHHCTRCDLRFVTRAEVSTHLELDHGAEVSAFDRYRYPSSREAQPLYPDLSPAAAGSTRIVVVANQTLGGEALHAALRGRLDEGSVKVHIVVPATAFAAYPRQGSFAAVGAAEALVERDEAGEAQARWRLRRMLGELRDLGVEATGEIGPPDPYEAAAAALDDQPADEVIVSTLDPERSRWVGMDLPRRLQRVYNLPVRLVHD
jgi:hypothetical protein